jgi:hypothetical protein
MGDDVEMPNEAVERHEQAHGHAGHGHAERDPHVARMTLLIIMLATAAAIAGKVSTEAELGYLTHHIAQSDIYSEYQGKSDRETVSAGLAKLASLLPNASDPAAQQAIAEFRATAAHMASDEHAGNGKAQLAAKAAKEAVLRDAAAVRLEGFEYVVSVLAIAIGIGSASLLAGGRLPRMVLGGVSAAAGVAAAAYGVLVFFGLN